MIRIIVIGGVLVASASALAQPNRLVCTDFEPQESDLREFVAEVSPAIPSNASLESACFTESRQITDAYEVSDVRQYRYEFSWPIEDPLDGVKFYRKSRCATQGLLPPSCRDLGSYALWKGSLLHYGSNITTYEVTTILDAVGENLQAALSIRSIEQVVETQRSQRFAGLRRYSVVVDFEEGAYSYWFEHECSTAADCEWRVIPRGRYIELVY